MSITDINQAKEKKRDKLRSQIEAQITLPIQERTKNILEKKETHQHAKYIYNLLSQEEYSINKNTTVYEYENVICDMIRMSDSIQYMIKAMEKVTYLDNFMSLISWLSYTLSEKERNQIRKIFNTRYPQLIKNNDIPHSSEQPSTINDISETK